MQEIEEIDKESKAETQYTYYYNQEERLKNAPKIVKDYYAGGGPRPTKGLFRVLVSNRGNRFLLVTILLLSAFILIYSNLKEKSSLAISNLIIKPSAMKFDEKVYITLAFSKSGKEKDKKKEEGTKKVLVTFYAINKDNEEAKRIEEEGEYNTETFSIRAVFQDYDIKKINCHVELSGGGEEKNSTDFTVFVKE